MLLSLMTPKYTKRPEIVTLSYPRLLMSSQGVILALYATPSKNMVSGILVNGKYPGNKVTGVLCDWSIEYLSDYEGEIKLSNAKDED